MEVMEEGNLMDRVQILLQRDLAYYEGNQKVLQEKLCSEVVGGQLDFPHHASFASVKLVSWWEGEYVAAFHKPSGFLPNQEDKENAEQVSDGEEAEAPVRTSVPEEFARLTESSSAQLLEHLHTLSQEALDHADLTVLTGTLGAAALTRNSLWCYNELLKRGSDSIGLSLHSCFKQFSEMVEALAERLLDLHNRLLSLYILQDADSLNWEHNQPFFEGLRGSFIVQMWWLYMQGTKEDLWNTVPPKTAQRVFAGMLNESLTILTVRYSQATPSMSRGNLLVLDIGNILLCVRHLLPAICTNKAELVGLSNQNKVVRDIHAKCHELLCCLIVRGCPLAVLYKHFRRIGDPVPIFSERPITPAPWYMVVSPHFFPILPKENFSTKNLQDKIAVALDLIVLMAQPEASWPLLLKVLLMRKSLLSALLFQHLIHTKPAKEESPKTEKAEETKKRSTSNTCEGFLCSGNCRMKGKDRVEDPLTQTACAVVHIATSVGCIGDLGAVLQPILECPTSEIKSLWGCCDGRQVWDEYGHPAWFKSLTRIMASSLEPVIKDALAKKGQLRVLLEGVAQLAECLPTTLNGAVTLLEDALPADVRPLGGSVLIQIVGAALYSLLMEEEKDEAIALAEALCNMDKRKYHDQIKRIKQEFAAWAEEMGDKDDTFSTIEEVPHIADVYVSHLLLTDSGKQALKITYRFLQHNLKWILGQLEALDPREICPPMRIPKLKPPDPPKLLHTMFNIGAHKFDELLTGAWNMNWKSLLQTPLSLTPKKMWTQLTYRPEFREPYYLNEHDKKVVETISKYFSHHHATKNEQRS